MYHEEPRNLDEALTRRRELLADILKIEVQLSDKNKTTRTGERLSASKYKAWRSGAHRSMVHKRIEYQFIKDWIRKRRVLDVGEELGIDAQDVVAILRCAHVEIQKVLRGDDEDRLGKVFELIDKYLRHVA